jgi:WD40 repeat protein
MDVPSREALLDIAWLEREHVVRGTKGLEMCLRRGAERYGGAVNAVADAALSFDIHGCHRLQDGTDFRHFLAHRLLAGSWSPAAEGPSRYRREAGMSYMMATASRERREAFWAKAETRGYSPAPPPTFPSLSGLRLIPSVEGAWVAHAEGIWGCDVSPDGRFVVSGSRDRTLAVWDTETDTLVSRVGTGHGDIRDCFFTADNTRVVSAHADGTITVWRSSPLEEVFATHTELPQRRTLRWRRMAASPDSNRLAVADWEETVEIWDLQSGTVVGRLHTHPTHSLLGVFWPTPTQCATVVTRGDGLVSIWDVAQQRVTAQHAVEMPRESPLSGNILTATVTSDLRVMVAATDLDTVAWELGRAEHVARVGGGIAGRALAISRDARYVATSESRDVVRLRTLPALTEIGRWSLLDLGCRDLACAVAFSPDNSSLIVAGWEGVIRRIALPLSPGVPT